ncbi:MAG TPA: TatD family hydrolase [Kiritimatiellia bacterium]|nr:TatD family hydrolase [Kiritimatiellia bacterium]
MHETEPVFRQNSASNALPELFDAHNHLHDERFGTHAANILDQAKSVGVKRMVVNGSCEEDWPEVARLAAGNSIVIPSYGLHPWYHHQRGPCWLDHLRDYLRNPEAGVGEIGLDRWKQDLPYEEQEDVFLAQWELARKLNRPASLHCLKAWGHLLELLQQHPGPECGFLLHSYGGPVEMIPAFVKLGAYFSFPGYYMHERKEKQQNTFKAVPADRLLIETDAPDQLLPKSYNLYPLVDSDGNPLNHPANLAAIYTFTATLRGLTGDELEQRIKENFHRLFADKKTGGHARPPVE